MSIRVGRPVESDADNEELEVPFPGHTTFGTERFPFKGAKSASFLTLQKARKISG